MRTTSTWSIIAATAIGLIVGSAILLINTNDDWRKNLAGFITSRDSPTPLGVAEAANVPLDVKENFRLIEKTGDARNRPSSLSIEEAFVDPDEHCEYCFKIEFEPGVIGRAGAILKSDKAKNIQDAERMVLFARGESGTEVVRFKAGGKITGNVNGAEPEYAFTSKNVRLDKEWQRFEIDLSAVDLSRITHAFEYEIVGSEEAQSPIVIYLKGITFDARPAARPIPAS
jgi:hypothetical protein